MRDVLDWVSTHGQESELPDDLIHEFIEKFIPSKTTPDWRSFVQASRVELKPTIQEQIEYLIKNQVPMFSFSIKQLKFAEFLKKSFIDMLGRCTLPDCDLPYVVFCLLQERAGWWCAHAISEGGSAALAPWKVIKSWISDRGWLLDFRKDRETNF
jgi:hypothetical protein